MSFFRSVARSLQLVGFFVVAGTELLVKRPPTQRGRAEWLHHFCAMAVKGLGVEMEVVGDFPERGAVISNHLSYVDIVIFAALRGPRLDILRVKNCGAPTSAGAASRPAWLVRLLH